MSEQFRNSVEILNNNDAVKIRLDGDRADITVGENGQDGDLVIKDSQGRDTFHFDSSHAALYVGAKGNEGDIIVRDQENRDTFHFDSSHAALYVGTKGNEGDIIVRDQEGREAFRFDSSHAALYVGTKGNEGDIIVRDQEGRETFRFDSSHAALYVGAEGNEGDIIVRDGSGNERIRLDGNSGDIRLQGADCAEEFNVTEIEKIDYGTVLVIGNENELTPCQQDYDKKVAGVVSGANGVKPGIILDNNPSKRKRLPIALSGKVFCKVDANYSPIEVGDMLTTSSTPGHAMKVIETSKAFGSVIGKALQPLKEGTAEILVLVNLQ